MEINKLNFDTVKTDEITKTFEELDVNGDEKITEADKTATTDAEITAQITKLLDSVDDEPELEEGADDADAAGEASGDTGEYAKLKAQLDAINKEIAGLDTQITALSDANKVLAGQKEDLETEKADKEQVLEEANDTLAREQDTLKDYLNKYEQIQEDIKRVNNEILAEQEREAATYEDSVDSITNKAIEEYNPETDGDDFNAFLLKRLDQGGYAIFSDLDNLNSKANSLDGEAVTLLKNITSQTAIVQRAKSAVTAADTAVQDVTGRLNDVVGKIQTNNDQIQGLEATKAAKETEKADVEKQIAELMPGGGLSAKELLEKIPQAEKDLIKEMGIDLKDCIVAMGMQDGNFHIYIPNNYNCCEEWPWISPFRAKYNYNEESLCNVPMGNGYLGEYHEGQTGDKSSGSGYFNTEQASAVYKFTCVNEDMTDGEVECDAQCYCTCSPLSFDVNGDGVKTSAETVSFDIDGDGVVDTVNNSSEWVLAFDKDHNGKAGENGSELFGDNTDLDGDGKADGYKNGFEALKALAQKEGLISATDTKLDENDIKFLQEKYGLTMTNGYGGEAKSLTDLGITEINLAQTDETTLTKNFDGRNNDIMTQKGATFTVNGQERDYADIWNAKKDKSEATDKDGNLLEEEQPFMPEVSMQQAKVTAKYGDKTLKLNDQRVIALEGKVEFEKIKNKIMAGAEVPKELLEEVIEIEDENA